MQKKIYHEVVLAQATTGYDVRAKQTLVHQWSLVAAGPDDLSAQGLEANAVAQAQEALQEAAQEALYEAAAAAYAVPGEIGARLAAAWEIFWQRFPTLAQQKAQGAIDQFIAMFEIGLRESVTRLDGLVLKAVGGKATAQMYAELYDKVTGALSGDAKKVAEQYFAVCKQINEAMTVDIDFELPRPISDLGADVAQGIEDLGKMPQRLAELLAQADMAEKQIDAVVMQASGFVQGVGQQFVDVASAQILNATKRLQNLDLGKPLLAFSDELQGQVGQAVKDLGDRLNTQGRQLLEDGVKGLQKAAEAAASDVQRLRDEAAKAITVGAEQTVARLANAAADAGKRFDDARKALEAGADELGQLLPGNAVASGVANTAAELQKSVTEAATQIAEAPAAAAQQAAVIVAKAAEEAAARIAEDARRAAEKAKSWVNDTFGTNF